MHEKFTGGDLYSHEARANTMRALGISPRESRHYSIIAALRHASAGEALRGYEGEVEQEMVRQFGPAKHNGGFRVPTGMAICQRDLSAATPSAGGYLVATDNLAGNFIDLLRARMVTIAMGATLLSGLKSNVTIPKLSSGGTAHWLANESTAITESTPTFGQVSMSPKTVGAYTELSRQLLMQSSPAADALVMRDLAAVVAQAIDAAAMAGTGASGQPTGIANTAGIGSVTGTSLDYAGILEFQSDCANALDSGTKPGYVTTPSVAALLKQRVAFANTNSPLWDGNLLNGKIADLPAMTSTGVPSASMIFGDWAQLLIGEWGMLEIATNPVANFQAGIIGIRAMQSVDVGVRHAAAFSMATSIT